MNMIYALLITFAAGLCGGFYTGQRWEKSERLEVIEDAKKKEAERLGKEIKELKGDVAEAENELLRHNSAFRGLVTNYEESLKAEQARVAALEAKLQQSRGKFHEVERQIFVVKPGTCSFTPDAVGVWNSVSEAANSLAPVH